MCMKLRQCQCAETGACGWCAGNEQSDRCHEDKGERSHDSIVNSDYRFVYLGPAGTKTPVHADVLNSFSW